MAIKDLVDKALLSAFWGNASEKIDARIAAAKASAATESTAGLVKPGSGLAVASDGTLSAKVDDSTIGFNSSGQLTALGGGGGGFKTFAYGGRIRSTFENWTICAGDSLNYTWCSGIYNDDLLYIQGIGVNFNNRSHVPIIVGRNDNKTFSLSSSTTNKAERNVNHFLVMPVYLGSYPSKLTDIGGKITIVGNNAENEMYLNFDNSFNAAPTYFGGGLFFVVNS